MRESRVRASGGLELCVCRWGEPDGHLPLLVLHGYLEQGAAWDAVAAHLPGDVVAPDHRGHGRSDHVGVGGFYHFWDYVADVDAVVASLGGKVDLVGHSMGGTIATLFAGTRPECVRRLALIEGLGPPDLTTLAVARSRAFLDARRDPPRHGTFADLEAGVSRMRRFNEGISEEAARRLVARITRPARPEEGEGLTWTWDPLHRATSPNPFDPRQFKSWVESVTAPVLVIDGGASRFRVPDAGERASWLRSARFLTIPGAGHLVHHDAPQPLAHALTWWFRGAA